MRIIGFSGKKQSGKTTAAEFLHDTVGLSGGSVRAHGFADELKHIINKLSLIHI